MMIYGLMAIMGFIALVWRIRIMEVLVISSAPIGAAFTIIALITGSLWGRPTWGTYWVWDARLTSELVLLFLYFGVIALYNAYDEPRKAARAASLMAIVGAINLPIIHFSVRMVEYPAPGQQYRHIGQQHPSKHAVAAFIYGHRFQVLLRCKSVEPGTSDTVKTGPPQTLGTGFADQRRLVKCHIHLLF